ncbi:MAG TPA: hypothetical protein VNZ58_03630 [Thermomicrobiales bacterium]|nr:hypothetical protein [Thermomicrobiales bacterium]
MSQHIVDLLTEVRNDLWSLPSMPRVYPSVPESINEFPAVVVTELGGRTWLSSHGRSSGVSPLMTEHDIRVEVHIPRKDLVQESASMTIIAHDVVLWLYAGFISDRYDATMVTTGNPRTANNATAPIDYTIGPSTWGGKQTYAMFCDFRVTTEEEVIV